MTPGHSQAARQAISERVAWLRDQPDGLLAERRSGLHRLLVVKEKTEIRLYFASPSIVSQPRGVVPPMSGRMSELELTDPLYPFVPYTQGMMLTLLWRPRPRRVCTIGFGAGRLPTILHAYFPELMLESTDIDTAVVPIAEEFFGFIPDERQKVVIQDGRDYLESRPESVKYDFIHVDAFRGLGHTAYRLGTSEFYQLCKRHLAEGGVVCTNVVETDKLLGARMETLAAAFENAYLFVHEDATVLFASDAPRLDGPELRKRGAALQKEHEFSFPLDHLSTKLRHLDRCEEFVRRHAAGARILSDAEPPKELDAIPRTDPMFHKVGRNEPCPCGSGRKFKKCHGRK